MYIPPAEQTKTIYEDIVKQKGDRWNAGYETSESESGDDPGLIEIKTKENEIMLDDEGNELTLELDKDELYQQEFEAALER